MKKLKQFNYLPLIAIGLIVLIVVSCEKAFVDDGDAAIGINSSQNYLYVIENGSKNLLMLDKNMNTIQTWDLSSIVNGNDVRGVTCNDEYLWISVTGSMDQIIQLASVGNSLLVLNTMDAPPDKKGTIRDLTWDGSNLWALNSGSTTSNNPGQLFKIDTETNTVLETFDLNISNARGITYVGTNGDIYGHTLPIGIYITDVSEDKVYVFDERTNFYESFDVPLHPRGVFYTSPTAISFSDNSFYIINVSASSGNYLYDLGYNGENYKVNVENMIEFPFGSPTAIQWSNFDFRQGIDPEVLSVVPNTAKVGESLTVNIIGKGFTSDLTVSFGEGITVEQLTYENSTSILADIVIASNVSIGALNVTITDADGNSFEGASMFNIIDRNPIDGFLLYCDNNDGSINKIKISDLSLIGQWFPDYLDVGSLQGLEFYENSLWISSGGLSDEIFKLDTATMTVVSSIDAPPAQAGTVREMAFDENGDIWVLNSSEDAIYKMNKADGSIISTIDAPELDTGARGIVFADGVLYCVNYKTDNAYTYDFTSSTWTVAFAIPVPSTVPDNRIYPTGITFDGVNFWISNSSYEHDYLLQVSTTGALLQTVTVPNAGDAKVTGVAFTY